MRVLVALVALVAAFIAPAGAKSIEAVEYYHAGFDHYFITASPSEAAILDTGVTIKGWKRTGYSFQVEDAPGPGLSPVCRFFSTAFGSKSSHFYTASTSEYAVVKANPNWQYEGDVFFVYEPTLSGCAQGTEPIYRLYNNGQGGAPNHRYTTDLAVRSNTIAKGWIPEGVGSLGVVACAPAAPTPATAEGLWYGTTSAGSNVVGFVLDTGVFYFLYMRPGTSFVAGEIQGNGSVSGDTFTSSNARDFNLAQGVFNGTITGSLVPRSSLVGVAASQMDSVAFSLVYDPIYEQPASLADAAGVFVGDAVGSTGNQKVTLNLNSSGAIVGSASGGCSFKGTATRHGNVNVFDISVKFGGGACAFGTATLTGIAYYDHESRRLYATAPNASRTDGFLFIGAKP